MCYLQIEMLGSQELKVADIETMRELHHDEIHFDPDEIYRFEMEVLDPDYRDNAYAYEPPSDYYER